jgi:iron complex transport system ATP-binding protein
MLVAEHLAHRHGTREVLRDVSLDVAAGELVALVGPNGAGKSTLLALLAGDMAPARGTVRLDGRPITDWPVEALARRRALLPQTSTLAAELRVREVALLGRAPFGDGHRVDVRARVDRVLAALALDALAERSYLALSGGERQRVHLARVLVQAGGVGDTPPGLCLLDEPTNSLDPLHQHTALGAARDLADDGGAVVVVLHDLNLAARYADRIVLLCRGGVLCIGEPAAVLRPEPLQSAYGIPMRVLRDPCRGCPLVVV